MRGTGVHCIAFDLHSKIYYYRASPRQRLIHSILNALWPNRAELVLCPTNCNLSLFLLLLLSVWGTAATATATVRRTQVLRVAIKLVRKKC